MEDALDEIARGEAARVPWLRRFYFGADGEEGLKELVSDLTDIDAREVSSFPLAGSDIVDPGRPVRALPGARRPAGEHPRGHRPGRADRRARRRAVRPAQRGPRRSAPIPETGHEIVARAGRFGPYVTEQPRRPATATDRAGEAAFGVAAQVHDAGDGHAGGRAASCSRCPGTLGELDGEPVTAQNGRYGPYVKKGTDSRSLDSEEQLFDITLDRGGEAVRPAQAARPPGRRGRGPAAARARRGPRVGQADGDQGRPVGAVRDRRRDQRLAPQGRRGGIGHAAARRRTARRAAHRPRRRRRAARPAARGAASKTPRAKSAASKTPRSRPVAGQAPVTAW